jgi:hypothetical protein
MTSTTSSPTPAAESAAQPTGGVHRIAVVRGGAGGLELATRRRDKLGRRGRAHVTLIDKARTRFCKPHLHEIAVGSADLHSHATDDPAQSHWRGVRYRIGEMVGIDREKREVVVAPAIVVGGHLWVEGLFARTMDRSPYTLHEPALHGFRKTAPGFASRVIARGTEPRVKLH